jgi:ABC-2 type transport system ATP-binding protein
MNGNSTYALELDHVSKRFSNKAVVDEISLQVTEGEVFGLLGPNGAGKTTTIRMIVGLIRPTFGHIRLFGSDLHSSFKRAIQQVGAIVENPDFYPHLTGYLNLKILAKMTRGVTDAAITDAVKSVGLTDSIHRRISTYSLGMRQRLGLAQALLHRPKLLILDEPTNGLDPIGIRELRQLVRKLSQEMKVSVFLSSHLLSEVQEMCDRVGVMNQGRLICVKSVESLVSESLHRYRLGVSDVEEAVKVAKELGWSVEESGSTTILIVGDIDTATLTTKLALSGVGVSSVEPVTLSLEDIFMHLVEEGAARNAVVRK